MNDKIYELAKQAGLIEFDNIPGSNAVTPSYESVVKARMFGELMYDECIDAIPTDLDPATYYRVLLAIKQHFGVKNEILS